MHLQKITIWLRAIRAPFFTASIIPVLVGTSLARQEGFFNLPLFLCALAAVVSNHAGANLLNDYYDAVGSDPVNRNITPFSGGSRLIQEGILQRADYLRAAFIALGINLAITLTNAAVFHNGAIALLGLGGMMLGVLYSVKRVFAMGRGWGEVAVGFAFGPVSVMGGYILQTGRITWEAFASGIPVAFLVMGILILNEFPDWEADRATGKRNWIVRAGCGNRGVLVYLATLGFAYLTVFVGVGAGLFPARILFSYATIPLAVWIGIKVWRNKNKVPEIVPALAGNVALHLITGILICIGLYWK